LLFLFYGAFLFLLTVCHSAPQVATAHPINARQTREKSDANWSLWKLGASIHLYDERF
jgi:hypothetical protein